jgi:hypothetical protein
MISSFALACFAAIVVAIPAPYNGSPFLNTTSPAKNTTTISACEGNTANDRTRWCDDSIDTDWYNYVPNTGVTREVSFEFLMLVIH